MRYSEPRPASRCFIAHAVGNTSLSRQFAGDWLRARVANLRGAGRDSEATVFEREHGADPVPPCLSWLARFPVSVRETEILRVSPTELYGLGPQAIRAALEALHAPPPEEVPTEAPTPDRLAELEARVRELEGRVGP